MILSTSAFHPETLTMTAEEAFELQQQLGELLRYYVMTNGLAGAKKVDTGFFVKNGEANPIPSSFVIVISKDPA